MSVRAVLFDAVGTLLTAEPTVAAAYTQCGRKYGIELSEPDLRARFRAALARQESLDASRVDGATSEVRERQRWQMVVADVFAELPDSSDLFDELWEHFAQPTSWRVQEPLRSVWDELSAHGVTLGIASNFDARLARVCAGLPPLDQCQLFISSQIGYRKPHRKFFNAVESALGVSGVEILLIGDDLVNDVQGAVGAGWHSIGWGSSPLERSVPWVSDAKGIRQELRKLGVV
jgi:putative hydrolase of the HAD superfamily